MNQFNFKNDLILKKWVLGIAAFLMVFYLIHLFFADSIIRSIGSEIQQSAHQQKNDMDRFAHASNVELNRIQDGMKGVAEGIKKGAESMEKDFHRMAKELAEDKKMIEERHHAFVRDWYEQDRLAEKMRHETDVRWEREEKEVMANWGKEDKAKKMADLKRLMALYKPSIECEKRVFGQTTFHRDDPYGYDQKGIEYHFDQCTDLRRKKVL